MQPVGVPCPTCRVEMGTITPFSLPPRVHVGDDGCMQLVGGPLPAGGGHLHAAFGLPGQAHQQCRDARHAGGLGAQVRELRGVHAGRRPGLFHHQRPILMKLLMVSRAPCMMGPSASSFACFGSPPFLQGLLQNCKSGHRSAHARSCVGGWRWPIEVQIDDTHPSTVSLCKVNA